MWSVPGREEGCLFPCDPGKAEMLQAGSSLGMELAKQLKLAVVSSPWSFHTEPWLLVFKSLRVHADAGKGWSCSI